MKLQMLVLPLLLSGCEVNLFSAQQSQVPTTRQESAVTYPNSSEGLQSQVEAILTAIKEKDLTKEADLIRNLILPDEGKWFIEQYGPGFGASLWSAYRRRAPTVEEEIRRVFENNVAAGLMHPGISHIADPEAVNAPVDHFLNCMDQIVPLYQTVFLDREKIAIAIKAGPGKMMGGDLSGYFAYSDGSFRYIPIEILMRLPNQRPVRIHLGMDVMNSKLITPIYPHYTIEALRGGKVVVRLDVGLDGKIQEASVLSGDPILSQPLLNATKQWQFLPTLLDGDPVEVEVDVEMIFEKHF